MATKKAAAEMNRATPTAYPTKVTAMKRNRSDKKYRNALVIPREKFIAF
jgi:hypothetical protein